MIKINHVFLLGAAMASLAACSSDQGPGAIGSADDIVIRNAGDPELPPPPPPPPIATPETITQVEVEKPITPEAAETEKMPEEAEAAPAVSPAHAAEAAEIKTPETSAVIDPVSASAIVSAPVLETPALPAAGPMRNVKMTQPDMPAAAPETKTEEPPKMEIARVETPAVPVAASSPAEVEMTLSALQSGDEAHIKAVQEKLKNVGLYQGSVDGIRNTETLNAMMRYLSGQTGATSTPPVAASVQEKSPAVKETSAVLPKPLPAVSSVTAQPPVKIETPAVKTADTGMDQIKVVQKKLTAEGLYQGTETGVLDTATLNALVRYQIAQGLPVGGLNADTLKKMGVTP